MTPKEINQKLVSRLESVVEYLFPNGKRQNNEWRIGSVNGEEGQSLGIHLTGEKRGVWKDFSSGEIGDLIDLWMSVRGLSFVDALKETKQFIGVTDEPKFTTAQKSYKRPEKPKCHSPKTLLAYLTETRKLTAETVAAYKVAEIGSELLFPQLRDGELINVKYLTPRKAEGEKNRWRQESNCEPCLFGWQAIGPNDQIVVITEGEIDALSVFQAGYPALSVPSGAKNTEWLTTEYENLERFKEIILCLDGDDAGQSMLDQIIDRIGADRCRVAKLPLKDANEMLQAGRVDELRNAIQGAGYKDPQELRNAREYRDEVFQRFHGGMSVVGTKLPYPSTHDQFRIRPGELTIWTGINGHGKSQLLGDVIVDQIAQGERICIFSGEMRPGELLKRLVRQATGMRQPPNALIESSVNWLGGGLWIFDLVGTAKASRMLEVFAYARKRYGITQFVIDSLLKCGLDEDGYNEQKHFVEALCDFNKQHNVHIHLVAHQRKTQDETKAGGKMGVRGSGSITDLAENIFEVWRNKEKRDWEASVEDGKMTCFKQRNGEYEPAVNLWFHRDSYQYRDAEAASVRCYVRENEPVIDENGYVYF